MGQIAFIGDSALEARRNSDKMNSILAYMKSEYPSLSTIVQLGDFGYWPSIKHIGHWINSLKVPEGLKFYWIDGNHEDFDQMLKMGMLDGPNKLKSFHKDQVFYVPRGSVLNLCGYEILFLGGAESIDALYRKSGFDWFPRESITAQDVEHALASAEGKQIDIVVSHEAPRSFFLYHLNPFAWMEFGWKKDEEPKWENPSRDRLEEVLQAVKPNQWFFGHYHMSMSGVEADVRWRCLDEFEFYILEENNEKEA